jgi:hypothetical protein
MVLTESVDRKGASWPCESLAETASSGCPYGLRQYGGLRSYGKRPDFLALGDGLVFSSSNLAGAKLSL